MAEFGSDDLAKVGEHAAPDEGRLVDGGWSLEPADRTGLQLESGVNWLTQTSSVARTFGDGLFGIVIVNQRVTSGGSGDGGIIQGAWQAEADVMHSSDGIVGKERIGPAEVKVVPQVLRRFGQIHRSQLIARGNALVEGSEHTQAELTRERGLA